MAKATCYCCGKKGHISPQCPEKDTRPRDKWIKKTVYQHLQSDAGDVQANTKSIRDDVSDWSITSEQSSFIYGTTLATMQTQENMNMRNVVILDNGSTVDLFCNPDLVENIRKSEHGMNLATNVGAKMNNTQATIPGYGDVWYDKDAIANIFSFSKMKQQYRITYDSNDSDAFVIHRPDHKDGNIIFKCSENGLYFHSPDLSKNATVLNMVTTVQNNKKGYTARQIKEAEVARQLYYTIGCPNKEAFKSLLRMNIIKNCPVTPEHVDRAESIYGPEIGRLKGKSTRTKPTSVLKDVIAIPPEIYEKNYNLDLCIDVMYVSGIQFLVSIDKQIKYRAAIFIHDRTKKTLYAAIDKIFRLYNAATFKITTIHADGEFEPLFAPIHDQLDATFNYANPGDHVPEIERSNRTVKERCRAIYHELPYKNLPKILIKHLVYECIRKLNYFPVKGGVSTYYSPRMIIHNTTLDYHKHCQVSFGQYVHVNNDPNPTNTMEARTLDAIYLSPTESMQGGHYVLDLRTGRVITRRRVTAIPITESVIHLVEAQATKDKITTLKFTNRNRLDLDRVSTIAGVEYRDDNAPEDESDEEGHTDTDEEDDIPYEESAYDEGIDAEELAKITGVGSEDTTTNEQNDENSEGDSIMEQMGQAEVGEDNMNQISDIESQASDLRRSTRDRAARDRMNISDTKGQSYLNINKVRSIDSKRPRKRKKKVTFSDEINREQQPMEQSHNIITQSTSTKTKRCSKGFAFILVRTIQRIREKLNQNGIGTINNQEEQSYAQTYNVPQAIKKFGEPAKSAAKKEIKQLHDRHCFDPIDPKDLSNSERKKAMESLIFITEKRNVDDEKNRDLKARHCANGSIQRQYMEREEASSPTASNESVFITSAIDAKERREVATVDIPNAFIQTKIDYKNGDELIVMKVRGVVVDLLVELDPTRYGTFVMYEKGKKVIYLVVLRAIYGMLQSALLFYKKFRKDLEREGFLFNPYDPCVANKYVRGKQLTVLFHVDDVKVSCVHKDTVDNFIQWVDYMYGDPDKPIRVSRGKRHDYLAMILDYTEPGKVKIDMRYYMKKMLTEFPVKLKTTETSMTPANENLFRIDKSKTLEESRAQDFHTTVARALFVSKRARPDIQPTVAALCTRVQSPNETDWGKLMKLMKYLNGTQELMLTLTVDSLTCLKFYVDAAFAVHPDFKSHTGMYMTMGGGAIQALSRKQKLNTKSSTESELVGADDAANLMLWTKLFIEAQGYNIEKNILYQDNKSTILLQQNGTRSSGKRTRHLNIRYYFLTDQISKGNLQVEYCPTDEMIGDYMSKPLQGEKFRKFRKLILNMK